MPETSEQRARRQPTLTGAQVERIAKVGRRRTLATGEIMYDLGDRNTAFFVVVEGALEVVRLSAEGEVPVGTVGTGQFTGEINMLSGRNAIVRCRVTVPGVAIEVDRDHLRELVQRDFELSNILISTFIFRRVGLISAGTSALVLIGSRHSADTMKLREFLTRNSQPFMYEDVDADPAVQALLDRFQVTIAEVPVVICGDGRVHRNPSTESLAKDLGLDVDIDAETVHDVVIVGAGPAGLAAAVYGASEGLDVLVLEGTAPGGQAGTSSRIENYLGFPTGISGSDLAGRAFTQAQKFGAKIAIGRRAARIDCDSKPYKVILEGGEVVRGRTFVIASGVRYRKPELADLGRFEGTGVFYSATHLEAQLCAGEHVVVVGGGNSAGQAAVFLSRIAASVHILIRGKDLADRMSRYLIQRLTDSPIVEISTRTQIESLDGKEWLESVSCRNLDTGEATTLPVRHIFMMTGADPHTQWLEGCVRLDAKGFIKTGLELNGADLVEGHWPLSRPPHTLETTIPGVFAVGDARSESTKRVASAVGEGAMCVQLLHHALTEL
jgi:thioredoxin reductase (NADPH)